MRLVTLSTALALSFAFSLSTPASAVPVKKSAAAKSQAASAVPAKRAATVKGQRLNTSDLRPQARKKVQRVRRAATLLSPDMRLDPTDVRPVYVSDARADTTGSIRSQPTRMPRLFASSDPVEEARRWIGTNPTDRSSLWCARFMNFVLERSGFSGTGSDAAKSFASYGRRLPGPQVGAIAVLSRGKNGGHVGIVSGVDASGNPIIISGNHGKQVGEGVYPRSRVIAYVMPH